jgi:hypothetical protein
VTTASVTPASANKTQWVRLLGGSSQKKQAAPNNPQQRLARFRQRYNQVLVHIYKPAVAATCPANTSDSNNGRRRRTWRAIAKL